jgi:hypothetical protein
MPIRTIGEYLKRWGFTPQKPVKRAYEQSSQAVQKWLERDYPVIFSRAKQEKTEIHWGDETGIQTGANRVRGFAPKGETTSSPTEHSARPYTGINVSRLKPYLPNCRQKFSTVSGLTGSAPLQATLQEDRSSP